MNEIRKKRQNQRIIGVLASNEKETDIFNLAEKYLYTEFSKQLSLFGSVRLLDSLSKEEIYDW